MSGVDNHEALLEEWRHAGEGREWRLSRVHDRARVQLFRRGAFGMARLVADGYGVDSRSAALTALDNAGRRGR